MIKHCTDHRGLPLCGNRRACEGMSAEAFDVYVDDANGRRCARCMAKRAEIMRKFGVHRVSL